MASHTRRQFLRVSVIGAAGFVTACGDPRISGVPSENLDGGSPGPDGGSELDGGVEADAGVDAGVLEPDQPDLVAEAFGFSMGIASGDVTDTRAVLWTRYVGPHPLRLRVWRMEGEVYAERVADVTVQPGDGGYVHLDVEGLSPGERYRYAFFEEVGGAPASRSAIGRFRAAFAPGTKAPLTVGACSCTEQGHTPTPLLRAGERDDLDLFVLLGDTTYNDGCDSLADFRTRWAANLGSPEYRTLRASTSVLATLDDHEVKDNFNPESGDTALIGRAMQAYFENLPLRRDAQQPDRVWKSMKWGDTAEFFILDSRGERKPSTRYIGQTQQYLSPAQMTWLKGALKASTAVFKVILNSTPITDFGFSAFTGDSWVAYPKERAAILEYIEDEDIDGVLWISGDHHFASVGKVTGPLQLGAGKSALEVLVGPGAQTANPAYLTLQANQNRWPFATGTNNYTTFAFDPVAGTVRVAFHDGAGMELFARDFTP